MEGEWIYTGYCRCLDGSRIVTFERYGDEEFCDCNYGSCPYEVACDIAQRIQENSNREGQ